MATDITSTSATSPKLVKKNSLADIRFPFPSTPKTYGCGECVAALKDKRCCRLSETEIDHIKARLESDQDETLKKYATIIQTIQKPASIVPHIAKSSSSASVNLQPTFLCFHCPHVATSEERDSHDKEHILCKRRDRYELRTQAHRKCRC